MLGRHESSRPRLLLAYADAAYASECGRYFRRLGWEVEMVASGREARELTNEYHPNVVALEAELLPESDWLASAEIPELQVVLVASDSSECDRLSIGAVQSVRRQDGAEALASSILRRKG